MLILGPCPCGRAVAVAWLPCEFFFFPAYSLLDFSQGLSVSQQYFSLIINQRQPDLSPQKSTSEPSLCVEVNGMASGNLPIITRGNVSAWPVISDALFGVNSGSPTVLIQQAVTPSTKVKWIEVFFSNSHRLRQFSLQQGFRLLQSSTLPAAGQSIH